MNILCVKLRALRAGLLLSSALVSFSPALANPGLCRPWTRYEVVSDDKTTEEGRQIIEYRCVDDGCVADTQALIERLERECVGLRERLDRLPQVEAVVAASSRREIQRAQDELRDGVLELLEALEAALPSAVLDAAVRRNAQRDINAFRGLVRRGHDYRRLGRLMGRLSTVSTLVDAAQLALASKLTWQALMNLSQRETDAEYLRGLMEVKQLNLLNLYGACGDRLHQAREALRGCYSLM